MLRLFLFFSLLLLILKPAPAHAHEENHSFNILINGEEGRVNQVKPSVAGNDFFVAEEIAPAVYQVGETIILSVEQGSEETLPETITWDTGALAGVLSGQSISLPLEKSGSYPIRIKISGPEEDLSHSILVSIADEEDYVFPETKIFVNNIKLSDTNSPYDVDLNKTIQLKAMTGSDNKYRYIWNFDNGETMEGKEISYKLPDNPYLLSPILRVMDENGIYQDTQFNLKNTSFGETEKPERSNAVLLAGVVLSLVVCVAFLLMAKRLLKNRL